mmetsp:Transcript_38353/g.126611  ORF Transcript_38353/g.126611 Transcript_38353/m.126611 type:complete len:360 (+) Transcript_38353:1056-2135(+)
MDLSEHDLSVVDLSLEDAVSHAAPARVSGACLQVPEAEHTTHRTHARTRWLVAQITANASSVCLLMCSLSGPHSPTAHAVPSACYSGQCASPAEPPPRPPTAYRTTAPSAAPAARSLPSRPACCTGRWSATATASAGCRRGTARGSPRSRAAARPASRRRRAARQRPLGRSAAPALPRTAGTRRGSMARRGCGRRPPPPRSVLGARGCSGTPMGHDEPSSGATAPPKQAELLHEAVQRVQLGALDRWVRGGVPQQELAVREAPQAPRSAQQPRRVRGRDGHAPDVGKEGKDGGLERAPLAVSHISSDKVGELPEVGPLHGEPAPGGQRPLRPERLAPVARAAADAGSCSGRVERAAGIC